MFGLARENEIIAILNVEEVDIETKLSAVQLEGNVSCGFKLKPLKPSSEAECSPRCQPHCTQIQKPIAHK